MTTVSIVTPSYNQAGFLERCISSIPSRIPGVTIEFMVVDGGSTDGTTEVLERNSHRIDFWCSERDRGPAAALNKGFRRATGSFYGYINADDYFLSGSVRRILSVFSEYEETDIVHGHGIMVDAAGRTICRIYSDRWNLEWMLYGRCSVVQQGTFFRAEAFERARGFNEKNRTCWDAELLVDMAVEGARFRRLDEKLGAFRIHESSISGSGRLQKEYRRDRRRIREKIVGEESFATLAVKTRWFGAQRLLREPRLSLKRAKERIRRRVRWMRRDD